MHSPVSLMNRVSQAETAVFQVCRFAVFPNPLFRLFTDHNSCLVSCVGRKTCPLHTYIVLLVLHFLVLFDCYHPKSEYLLKHEERVP